ncbi:MAG: hypothetical protein WCD70_10395, partial [Alphaproteobacteria bacterium]
GIKRAPTRHQGVRPKVKGSSFNGTRSIYPRSPVVKTTKTTSADGTIRVIAAISHSALNNIGQPNPPPFFPSPPTRKGWPPEAVSDWEVWGQLNKARFFALWPELT